MTTHEIDLDALKALVNDRWKMVEESKQLGDSEGVIWDDDEMARYEYLRHQISKGDAELAIAFPALVARIEAAERERDAAMAALEPFAREAWEFDFQEIGHDGHPTPDLFLTYRHFAEAYRVYYASHPTPGDPQPSAE